MYRRIKALLRTGVLWRSRASQRWETKAAEKKNGRKQSGDEKGLRKWEQGKGSWIETNCTIREGVYSEGVCM